MTNVEQSPIISGQHKPPFHCRLTIVPKTLSLRSHQIPVLRKIGMQGHQRRHLPQASYFARLDIQGHQWRAADPLPVSPLSLFGPPSMPSVRGTAEQVDHVVSQLLADSDMQGHEWRPPHPLPPSHPRCCQIYTCRDISGASHTLSHSPHPPIQINTCRRYQRLSPESLRVPPRSLLSD